MTSQQEQQLADNTSSIQDLVDNALKPSALAELAGTIVSLDKLIVEINSSGDVVHINWEDLLESIDTSVKNINYSSIRVPQLFNPDAGEVTANTADFTLVSSEDIAFVTHNGQTLDDSEYSLTTNIITVTPDNGFIATDDELLVYQHSFTNFSSGNTLPYTPVTANYTILPSDHIIDCTANSFTLSLSSTTAGKPFELKNSGSGIITLNITIDGVSGRILSPGAALPIRSNGTNYIII